MVVGSIKSKIGDFAVALPFFKVLENDSSRCIEAIQWMILCCKMVHQFEGVIHYNLRLIKISQGYNVYTQYFDIGDAYLHIHQFQQAVDFFKMVEGGNPPPPPAVLMETYLKRFMCEIECGLLDDAKMTADRYYALKASDAVKGGGNSNVPYEKEKAILDSVFDMAQIKHVISLGGNCDISNALKGSGVRTYSIFDWLITPFRSIAPILIEDGARILNTVEVDKSRSVIGHPACKDYNILYMHNFPRAQNGELIINEDTINKARMTLKYKMSALEGYCAGGGPILFMRKMIQYSSLFHGYCDVEIMKSEVENLVNSIEKKYNIKNFYMLIFYNSEYFPDLKGASGADDRIIYMDEKDGLLYLHVIAGLFNANQIAS